MYKYSDYSFFNFSQQSRMIDIGQEKGKSLDHTKNKQQDDESLKMSGKWSRQCKEFWRIYIYIILINYYVCHAISFQ